MSALLQQMRQDNPSGLWPLQEASGTTAKDYSGNGINGTYTGSVTPGGRSTALGVGPDFSGGYVDIPDHALLSPQAGAAGKFTLEIWAYADSLPANAASWFFNKAQNNAGAGDAYEWGIGINNLDAWTSHPVLYQNVWYAGGAAIMAVPLSTDSGIETVVTGRLYQFVTVFDRAVPLSSTWHDAVVKASTGTLQNAVNGTAGDSIVRIGHRGDNSGVAWDGVLQYAAVYPTVLSNDRIMSHFKAGVRSRVVY